MIPTLAGVHHVKLPVADLDRSIAWYGTRLGYRPVIEFRKDERRTGAVLDHPAGGPQLGLVLWPEKARQVAGFDFFSIGVPDRVRLEELAAYLSGLGEQHAGVQFASIGWILPLLRDPDGHEIRFYTMDSHTPMDPDHVLVVDDPIGTSTAREAQWSGGQSDRAHPHGESRV